MTTIRASFFILWQSKQRLGHIKSLKPRQSQIFPSAPPFKAILYKELLKTLWGGWRGWGGVWSVGSKNIQKNV